jgi:hypothetical protein
MISSPLTRVHLNDPLESGPIATVRWCREAVQLTRVVQYPSCFDFHRDTQEPSGQAASNTGADDEERQALRAEGLDPDDPAVRAGIDLVRWELSMLDELAD